MALVVNESDINHATVIKKLIHDSDEVRISLAFIKSSDLATIEAGVRNLLNNNWYTRA